MPSVRQPILCTGADGITRGFEYEWDKCGLSSEWSFAVFSIPEPASGVSFECNVKQVSAWSVQIILIAHHGVPQYIKMGIPDAIIPVIAATLNIRVVSSPTWGGGGSFRIPSATKYWERLKAKGLAHYDSITDVYSHP